MKYLLFFSLAAFICSCDKRSDYYNSINSTPTIECRRSNSTDAFTANYMDSVKSRFPVYELEVNQSDEEVLSLKSSSTVSTDQMLMKDKSHFSITLDTKISSHTFSFKSVDSFGKEGQGTAKIVVFTNLLPEAEFEIRNIGALDPREYIIDATKSYDRDAKYGGKVVLYNYVIQEIGSGNPYFVSNSPSPTLKYIFPKKAVYTIGVGCIDDDGENSPIDSYNLTVN